MRINLTKPLFAWDCLEDSPSLRTIKPGVVSRLADSRPVASSKTAEGVRLRLRPPHLETSHTVPC